MSGELKEVRQRIGGTRQIRRVTSTLQRVAAARLRQDRLAIESAGRYRARLGDVLGAIALAAPGVAHPLSCPRGGGRVCVVIFGADRGLCGGFTTGLMDELERLKERQPPEGVCVVAVGKVAQRRARRAGWRVEYGFRQPSTSRLGARAARAAGAEAEGIAEVRRVTDLVSAGFLKGTFCAVHILYARFLSSLRQRPTVELLLPVTLPAPAAPAMRGAELEPAAEALLARLLPEYVFCSMLDAFYNSLGSEDAARQLAMSRATENAGALLDGLVMSYRRLRQDSITNEMIELCGARLEERRN